MPVGDWRTLSSERKYKGVRFSLLEDRVVMPGGNELVYPRIEKKPAVIVLGTTDEGKVPMVRQLRYPVQSMELELPAGHMEDGERPVESAARELEEETGYRASSLEHFYSYNPTNEVSDQTFHVVLAKGLEDGEPGEFETTFIEHEDVELEHLLEMIRSGDIRDGRTVTAVLVAREKGLL